MPHLRLVSGWDSAVFTGVCIGGVLGIQFGVVGVFALAAFGGVVGLMGTVRW